MLSDGRYGAFVVDVEAREHDAVLAITITEGSHKGEVVDIATRALSEEQLLALIGVACTLVVERGVPRIER